MGADVFFDTKPKAAESRTTGDMSLCPNHAQCNLVAASTALALCSLGARRSYWGMETFPHRAALPSGHGPCEIKQKKGHQLGSENGRGVI